MARLTNAQRMDNMEQERAGLPARMAELVTAMAALKTDLAAQISAGHEQIRAEVRLMLPGGSPSNEVISNQWVPPTGAPMHNNGGVQGGGSGNENWKLRKLDLPIFDGTNPHGWILRAERLFHFYRLNEED